MNLGWVGLTLVFTVLTIMLALPRPGAESHRRLDHLTPPAAEAMRRNGRLGVRLGLGVLVGPMLIGLGIWSGFRGVAFGSAALVVGGTVILLLRRRGRRQGAIAHRTAVAQACSVLAAQVRIGQIPSEALRAAAEDCPVLEPARDTVAIGGDPVDCWRTQASTPGLAGLADLARAWRLSTSAGSELAPALEEVAEALASDQALSLVVRSEAAAPRATGKIMAVLPLVGIGLGYVMGGDPMAFLLGTPVGWTCLLLGSCSACVGVLWMEKIADRATAEA